MITESETSLWMQVTEDKSPAFDKLYRLHVKALFNYGTKFTSDYSLVEDSIQQTFLILWQNRATITIKSSFKAYLYITFKNNLIKKLQTRNKKIPMEFTPELISVSTREDEIIRSESEKKVKKNLDAAMEDLSTRQKEAIYLKFYEKMEYGQISEIMSIKVPAVYKLISSGLQRMKKKL